MADINKYLPIKYADERQSDHTDEQFLYSTRKKAFGDFKKELWHLPGPNHDRIMEELENRFSLTFRKLNVTNTIDLVKRYVVDS